ncbi:Uncharacterized conserved protein [Pantoea agglomerans]|uniref:Uncharacterized conserved protein n=1 Tax=Enterobacter agglomerans TaxID=549 RepID=A0A379LTG0_ENTAG|nr:Uncharacterized conserved protein [Pantoea agglomerans]
MQNEMTAQCHCGAVAYRVTLKDGFNTVRRCNCSFCRMRGAVVVFATKVELTAVKRSSQSIVSTAKRWATTSVPFAAFTPFIRAAHSPISSG